MLFCAFATIVHLFCYNISDKVSGDVSLMFPTKLTFATIVLFFATRYMARPMVKHCCYNQIDFVILVLSWMQK
jgi:hypothetical protein